MSQIKVNSHLVLMIQIVILLANFFQHNQASSAEITISSKVLHLFRVFRNCVVTYHHFYRPGDFERNREMIKYQHIFLEFNRNFELDFLILFKSRNTRIPLMNLSTTSSILQRKNFAECSVHIYTLYLV